MFPSFWLSLLLLDENSNPESDSKIRQDNLPVFITAPRRPTQLPVKFIRWLRNNLYAKTSWVEAMGALKRTYAVF